MKKTAFEHAKAQFEEMKKVCNFAGEHKDVEVLQANIDKLANVALNGTEEGQLSQY